MNCKLVKTVVAVDILLGLLLAAWSAWRFVDCGYDCGLFEVQSGPAAVVGLYLGLAFALLSAVLYLVIHLKSSNTNAVS